MKKHKIKITESFVYEIEVEANSQKEAIEKAKNLYADAQDGYLGVADGNSYDGVRFNIIKNN